MTLRFKFDRSSRTDGDAQVKERDLTVRIRSKDVVVRPGIVRIEAGKGVDDSVILRGKMNLYNVPAEFHPDPKKFKLRIGDMEFDTELKQFVSQKLSSACHFELCLAQEQSRLLFAGKANGSFSNSKEWFDFSFSLDGLEVSGLRCVLFEGQEK